MWNRQRLPWAIAAAAVVCVAGVVVGSAYGAGELAAMTCCSAAAACITVMSTD